MKKLATFEHREIGSECVFVGVPSDLDRNLQYEKGIRPYLSINCGEINFVSYFLWTEGEKTFENTLYDLLDTKGVTHRLIDYWRCYDSEEEAYASINNGDYDHLKNID